MLYTFSAADLVVNVNTPTTSYKQYKFCCTETTVMDEPGVIYFLQLLFNQLMSHMLLLNTWLYKSALKQPRMSSTNSELLDRISTSSSTLYEEKGKKASCNHRF